MFKNLVMEKVITEVMDSINSMSEDEQVAIMYENPDRIIYIDNPSEKVQLAAVNSKYPENNSFVLGNLIKRAKKGEIAPISDEVIKQAVIGDGFAIRCLTKTQQTPEIQMIAIRQNPNTLLYFWGEPAPEVVEEGKRLFPDKFDKINENRKELVQDRLKRYADKKAEEQNPYYQQFLNNNKDLSEIPAEEITERMAYEAVKQNPQNLKYIPIQLRDSKICYTALTQDLSLFDYVPKNIDHYEDIIREAEYLDKLRQSKKI